MPFDALDVSNPAESFPRKPEPLPPRERLRHKSRVAVMMLDKLEYLFQGGDKWTQHCFVDTQGRMCLLGAIGRIEGLTYPTEELIHYLSRALNADRYYCDAFATFNDADDRKYSDIRRLITKARRLARKDA